jgi:branched-subunit amino acid transport protein
MKIWFVMLALGLATFLTRFSFIALLGKFHLPADFRRALRFVPVAVLSAIIAPELGLRDGALAITWNNPRLVAGIVATLVAYFTKNVILTILVGMVTFWLLLSF